MYHIKSYNTTCYHSDISLYQKSKETILKNYHKSSEMRNITLQLFEDLLQNYKDNVIQRVNVFKNTSLIHPSNERDTTLIKNDTVCVGKKRKRSTEVKKKFVLKANEENIIDKVDYLHYQVLRRHSSVKSIIKLELRREITSQLTGYYQSVCLYINEIVNRITFEKPTEKNPLALNPKITSSLADNQ